MKNLLSKILILILVTFTNVFPQWNNLWTSEPISDSKASGWLSFQKTGKDNWKSRMYTIDSTVFQIMQEGYSNIPQYSYSFSSGERSAGVQFYSLMQDLTGDDITEFYVLAYEMNGRQSMKIIDIANNAIVFQRNQTGFSFSEPTILDIDKDEVLECVITKWEYPYQYKYYHEVYSTGISTGITKSLPMPVKFELKQNYPNPFNPETNIEFSIDIPQQVIIKIFDIKGELIRKLVDDFKSAGSHTVKWDGTNLNNKKMPTGVYFYNIEGNNVHASKKMILLK